MISFRRVVALCVFALLTLAATAQKFPNEIADQTHFKRARNNVKALLRSPLYPGDTVMTVTDASRFEPDMQLTIDEEIVVVRSISGNQVTIERGFDGTTPTKHLAGRVVANAWTAWDKNVLAEEIMAIERTLGPGLSNVPPNNGTLNSALYAFAPQQPGGSLIASTVNVVTLDPCPAGVRGTNTKHYLYISGGTGTAEKVLITGGSCVPGSIGTINFTPQYNHSGAWSISSATDGMTEAAYTLGSNGGTVFMPTGSHQLRAPIPFRENWRFVGAGPSTRLIPESASGVVFDSALSANSSSESTLAADNVAFEDFAIDGHSYNGVNSVYGIKHTLTAANEFTALAKARIRNVSFNNIYNAIYAERVYDVLIQNSHLYANSRVRIIEPAYDTAYRNFQVVVDTLKQSRGCMDGDCSVMSYAGVPVLDLETCVSCRVVNSDIGDLVGGVADGIRLAGAGEGSMVTGTTIVAARRAISLDTTKNLGVGADLYPNYVKIMHNDIDQPWESAVWVAPGKAPGTGSCAANGDGSLCSVNNLSIIGNVISNLRSEAANGSALVTVGDYSRHTTITGNLFFNIPFPLTSSNTLYGVYLGAYNKYFSVSGNRFNSFSSTAGANVTGVYAAYPADYSIVGNGFYQIAHPVDIAGGFGANAQIMGNSPASIPTQYNADLHYFGGANFQVESSGSVSISGTSGVTIGGPWVRLPVTTFSTLGTPTKGRTSWCEDCTVGATCSGSGSGAQATGTGSQWRCY